MKRLKYILLLILFIVPIRVNAASATIGVSASTRTLVVGNTVTVTVKISSSAMFGAWQFDLKHDSSKLTLQSGDTHVVGYTNSATGQKTATYTYKFKAKSSGTTNVSVINSNVADFASNSYMSVNNGSVQIKVITQAELEASYSKNNYLSSLKINDYELTPEFNKDTLEYNVELKPNTENINISGNLEDSKSSVEGFGDIKVSDGLNKIEIKVTAQNGNLRTYIINATVKELEPINVTVNGETRTVVRKKDLLKVPNNYTETTTLINGTEVPALYSDITKYTLIGLKDNDGKIDLYMCGENDNYTIYNEINFNNIKLFIKELDTSSIPKYYIKSVTKINDIDVTIYKLKETSDYGLIYGVNIDTGKESIYMYDEIEHTIQRYNQDETNKLTKEKDFNLLLFIISIGTFLLTTIIVLLVRISKKNKKPKPTEEVLEELEKN